MIEQRLRAIETDEPPLGFDPDLVVTKIATTARRRRAMIGSGLVVVAVLALAALVPTLRPSKADSAVAAPEPWETHIAAVLAKIAPQVKEVSPAGLFDGGWEIPMSIAKSHTPPEPRHAIVRAVGTSGYTAVRVERFTLRPGDVDLNRVCELTTATTWATCTRSTLPDGSTAFDVTIGDPSDPLERSVEIFRTDGSMIYASSDVNQREVGQHPTPLTMDQLRQLATDPVFAAK